MRMAFFRSTHGIIAGAEPSVTLLQRALFQLLGLSQGLCSHWPHELFLNCLLEPPEFTSRPVRLMRIRVVPNPMLRFR